VENSQPHTPKPSIPHSNKGFMMTIITFECSYSGEAYGKKLIVNMRRIDKDTFLRGFKVLSNQSFDLFLGAGASISSGIPSGSDLVWQFKRELLSVSGKINGKKLQDLKIESNKKIIQSYFAEEDAKVSNAYSYYF